MKLHTLSNEEAQEILDFLVQKHSLDGHIAIDDDYAAVKWKTGNIEIGHYGFIEDEKPFRLMKQYVPGGTNVHWVSCISYDRLLNYLLRASTAGMNVFVGKPVKTYLGWSIERVVFFPAYITLEEIFIEMDLHANKTT